jgi:hypothetical protein
MEKDQAIRSSYSSKDALALYVCAGGAPEDQRSGKKVFGFYVVLSNLESRRLKGSENQWSASPEECNACAANPVRLPVPLRVGCRNV